MSETGDWYDQLYDELYDGAVRELEAMRRDRPELTREEMEAKLQHLYTFEGQDWVGRGEAMNTKLAATIAAHEHILASWDSFPLGEGGEADG
jgi:hypothetical protein